MMYLRPMVFDLPESSIPALSDVIEAHRLVNFSTVFREHNVRWIVDSYARTAVSERLVI